MHTVLINIEIITITYVIGAKMVANQLTVVGTLRTVVFNLYAYFLTSNPAFCLKNNITSFRANRPYTSR